MSEGQVVAGAQEISWFWQDVGADVKQTLTAEQQAAIEGAVKKTTSGSQPADVRLHLGRYFVRITAGKERRNRERLQQDLANNPIFTAKNVPVITIFWILTLLATLYALAFFVNLLSRFVFV